MVACLPRRSSWCAVRPLRAVGESGCGHAALVLTSRKDRMLSGKREYKDRRRRAPILNRNIHFLWFSPLVETNGATKTSRIHCGCSKSSAVPTFRYQHSRRKSQLIAVGRALLFHARPSATCRSLSSELLECAHRPSHRRWSLGRCPHNRRGRRCSRASAA